MSCNNGFRLNPNAKFYKCENDSLIPLLVEEYILTASPTSTAVKCEPIHRSAAPKNVVAKAVSQDRITIEWEEPEIRSGLLWGYTIFYTLYPSNPLSLWENDSIDKGRQMITLNGLVPNCTYTIRVRAQYLFHQEHLSEAVRIMTRKGVFMPPHNLNAMARTPNELGITWDPPMGASRIISYKLFYCDSLFMQNNSAIIRPPTTKYKLTDLTPDTIYHLQMSARNQHGKGTKTAIVKARTPEFIPKEPKRVYAASINSNSIYVEWRSPNFPDWRRCGIIRGYIVYYVEVGDNGEPVYAMVERTLDTGHGDVREALIADLKPETRYRIQVAGYTRKGDGLRSAFIFVKTGRRVS